MKNKFEDDETEIKASRLNRLDMRKSADDYQI